MSATVSQSQNSQSSAKMPMTPVVMNSNSMNPTPNRSGKSQKNFALFSKNQQKVLQISALDSKSGLVQKKIKALD